MRSHVGNTTQTYLGNEMLPRLPDQESELKLDKTRNIGAIAIWDLVSSGRFEKSHTSHFHRRLSALRTGRKKQYKLSFMMFETAHTE